MADGQAITDYLSYGSGAPSDAPSLAVPGQFALYQDTTTGDLYVWDLESTAWAVVGGGGGGGLYSAYACVQDQETSGTNGGTFTGGSWQTRVLNTIVANAESILTLASNRITLVAGTYRVLAFAPVYAVDNHQLMLFNVTANTPLLYGQSQFASASNGVGNSALLTGRFTVSGTTVIELQHQCHTTQATYGLGVNTGFGLEVYASVELWQEGEVSPPTPLADGVALYTGSDISFTESSWTILDAAFTVTITTGAHRCLVTWQLSGQVTGERASFDIQVDGTGTGGERGVGYTEDGTSHPLGGTYVTAVLTAGSHVFTLMAYCEGGATLGIGGSDAGSVAQLAVIELSA